MCWTLARLMLSAGACWISFAPCAALLAPPDLPAYNARLEDTRVAAIFATINHIDVVNSAERWPERELLRRLLQHRTVRWYNTTPSTRCSVSDEDNMAADAEDDAGSSECYALEGRSDSRLHWEENRTGGYIIYGDLTELTHYACLFEPTGTYLLLANTGDTQSPFERTWLLQLLRRIWFRRGVYRVYVQSTDALYAYDPFRVPENTPEYGALVELGYGEALPRGPPNDFAGYPVRIEVFRSVYSNPVEDGPKTAPLAYTGVDVTARNVFCQALNASVLDVPADRDLFGDRQPNGSFTGALGRLIRRDVDIVFTGFFVKDYSTRAIDFTAGLYSDAVCCLVRKARRIPEALLPLYIFPGDIWALLGLLGLLCACVWCALRWFVAGQVRSTRFWSRQHRLAVLFNLPRRLRHASHRRLMLQLYIDAFMLLVSAPYLRFTRSGVERLFLTGLLMVSLIFVSLYQSGLSSVFFNPLYYPDIRTLQQLEETGMEIPVKYRGFIDDVFAVNYSRLMDSLRGRMRHLQVKESMLARVARLGNIATVTRKTTLALDNAIYLTTRQLHMVPECPRTYMLAYVTPHRSVFGERFNKILLRMVGGGLVDHWIDEARYEWTLRNWRVVQEMLESNFKILTVLDMQFAFYVLAIGLSLSVGAIGVELVRFRRAHKGGKAHIIS
uniref:Ionotropic glutamate receptor L-glutamate and glycine-binding domain-containing protein n=1 Tax=Anopheles farauti TaxID=69004 RepID=A0A182QPN2_9DIPT